MENSDELKVTVHCSGDILSQLQRENCRCDDVCEQYPGAVAIETEGIGTTSLKITLVNTLFLWRHDSNTEVIQGNE